MRAQEFNPGIDERHGCVSSPNCVNLLNRRCDGDTRNAFIIHSVLQSSMLGVVTRLVENAIVSLFQNQWSGVIHKCLGSQISLFQA